MCVKGTVRWQLADVDRLSCLRHIEQKENL